MGAKSGLYKFLRIWNDVDAVRKGRIKQRIARRITSKLSNKFIRKIFK